MTLLALTLDTRSGPAGLLAGLPDRLDRIADLVTIADGFADRELAPLLDTVLPALPAGRLRAEGTLHTRLDLLPAPNRHLQATSAA